MPTKSPLWNHFTHLPNTHPNVKYGNNGTLKKAWCSACVRDWIRELREAEVSLVAFGDVEAGQYSGGQHQDMTDRELTDHAMEDNRVPHIKGEMSVMARHIKNCMHITEGLKTKIIAEHHTFQSKNKETRALSTPNSSFASTSASSLESMPGSSDGRVAKCARLDDWSTTIQEEFNQDTCTMFADAGIAWNKASNLQMQLWVSKWVGPKAKIADRRVLSGRILDGEVEKVLDRTKAKVKGELVTGQCDGWKNIAKKPLLTTMFTAGREAYLVTTHNMSGLPKTGDKLFEIVLAEIETMRTRFGVVPIAWVTDDGPDGKKMRRLLSALLTWLITMVCWAHQINLVSCDVIKAKPALRTALGKANDIIKWFNNHDVARHLLRREQELANDGLFWALILPVLTRWASHYMSLDRLLKVKHDLVACAGRHREDLLASVGRDAGARAAAEKVFSDLVDYVLWTELESARNFLEPLAIASLIMQASYTRMDHVLITLGNLFRIYSKPEHGVDPVLQDAALTSFRKRWRNCKEQEVFILATLLNPYIRDGPFSRSAVDSNVIWNIALRAIRRFYKIETYDMAFLRALEDYINRRGRFTDEAMHLETIAEGYKSDGEDVDIVFIWKRIYDPHAPLTGANLLACLAIRVLTVITNSAGCERQFSDFGRQHTKLRNKLDEQTVHKTSLLRADVRRRQADLGLLQSRRKRKFGQEPQKETEATATSSVQEESTPVTQNSSLEADLNVYADFDNFMDVLSRNGVEEDELELPSATIHPEVVLPVPTTPSRPPPPFHAIGLDVLFDYERPDAIKHLGLFWNGGIRAMEREVSALDASGEEVLLV